MGESGHEQNDQYGDADDGEYILWGTQAQCRVKAQTVGPTGGGRLVTGWTGLGPGGRRRDLERRVASPLPTSVQASTRPAAGRGPGADRVGEPGAAEGR